MLICPITMVIIVMLCKWTVFKALLKEILWKVESIRYTIGLVILLVGSVVECVRQI